MFTKAFVVWLVLLFGLLLPLSEGIAQVYVQGYYRSDGTYVAPHWRSSPDGSYNNNWSVSPNVNPFTGRRGTRRPTWNDRPPESGFGGYNSSPYGIYRPRGW